MDIADEIKSESEINAAAEDANTNGNADAGTAQVLQDTVEYVESTKTEIVEEVKTQKVDKWEQPVYSKLMLDDFDTEMYEGIISEPDEYHKDENQDGSATAAVRTCRMSTAIRRRLRRLPVRKKGIRRIRVRSAGIHIQIRKCPPRENMKTRIATASAMSAALTWEREERLARKKSLKFREKAQRQAKEGIPPQRTRIP